MTWLRPVHCPEAWLKLMVNATVLLLYIYIYTLVMMQNHHYYYQQIHQALFLPADALLAEEVADLHRAAGDGHVDGEMGVTEAHLVQVSLSHTGDHVVHVRADRADARELQKARGRGGDARTTGCKRFNVNKLDPLHHP